MLYEVVKGNSDRILYNYFWLSTLLDVAKLRAKVVLFESILDGNDLVLVAENRLRLTDYYLEELNALITKDKDLNLDSITRQLLVENGQYADMVVKTEREVILLNKEGSIIKTIDLTNENITFILTDCEEIKGGTQ